MNKKEIINLLNKYNIDKENCIVLSGASLVVQGIIPSTSDIDIATTTEYYNSLNWDKKIGALGKEIKYLDNIEISNNLYEQNKYVVIDGYKFANLEFILEVKEMLYRLKDKDIIKDLRQKLYNKPLLKFLGIGSMQNYVQKNTSAYIKFDKTMLLIDCGMSTFFTLLEKNLIDDLDEIFVAITHTHPDHSGSLAALILYLSLIRHTKVNIIINEQFEEQRLHLLTLLRLNGVLPEYYNFINTSNVKSFFNITSMKIHHCNELDSYAYEIMIDENTTYYYLGDNNDPEFFINTCKKLRKNDFIFTDISTSKTNVHLFFDDISKHISPEISERLVFMHFSDINSMNILKKLGFNVATIE